jgi:hypothetical protein
MAWPKPIRHDSRQGRALHAVSLVLVKMFASGPVLRYLCLVGYQALYPSFRTVIFPLHTGGRSFIILSRFNVLSASQREVSCYPFSLLIVHNR